MAPSGPIAAPFCPPPVTAKTEVRPSAAMRVSRPPRISVTSRSPSGRISGPSGNSRPVATVRISIGIPPRDSVLRVGRGPPAAPRLYSMRPTTRLPAAGRGAASGRPRCAGLRGREGRRPRHRRATSRSGRHLPATPVYRTIPSMTAEPPLKGLIATGGKGSRLRPFTYTGAKQLVPIANKPVLFYGVEQLVAAGVTEIGVVVGDTGAQVREALGDGSAFGARFTFLEQE